MARHVNDEIAVSGQISADDVAAVAAAGFRAIICNRPDGETFDQTDYALIAAEAEKYGLEVRFQPVASGHVSDDDGRAFGELMAALPGPVFAYCRSGTRCIVLWSLAQAGRQPTPRSLPLHLRPVTISAAWRHGSMRWPRNCVTNSSAESEWRGMSRGAYEAAAVVEPFDVDVQLRALSIRSPRH